MRIASFVLGSGPLALLVAVSIVDAQEGKKKFKATQTWTGKIADDKAKVHIPVNGVITKAEPFKKLWEAWRPDDKRPLVNFDHNLVLVHIAGGPNIPTTTYLLDDKGNLKALSLSTLIGGPGFGYAIEVIGKEGIKTYQGKKVE
jgi:hypothetical protein